MNARSVKCPRCGKPSVFSPENANRPFCSERCKLIDLGAWAEEKYAIPVNPTPEDLAQLEEQLDEQAGEQLDSDESSSDETADEEATIASSRRKNRASTKGSSGGNPHLH